MTEFAGKIDKGVADLDRLDAQNGRLFGSAEAHARMKGVLTRSDLGVIASGMAADLALCRLDDVALVGALHDPLAALVFCAPQRADYTIVKGRVLVREGWLATLDLPPLVERDNRLAQKLVGCV